MKVSIGWFLVESRRKNLFHVCLLASGGYQKLLFWVCGQITPVSAVVFMWPPSLCLSVSFPFLSLKRTPVIEFRTNSNLG